MGGARFARIARLLAGRKAVAAGTAARAAAGEAAASPAAAGASDHTPAHPFIDGILDRPDGMID